MLVKINTSLMAGMAVALATSSNIGASAGMLRKTPDMAENGAAFKKDEEDAGVLDDVFTDTQKKQDSVVATGIANANSKAATTTVTLSKDSNVVTTKVHPNDDEAKKDNQDTRVLIDDVFTNTKNVTTIANTGSKVTTAITKDYSGMKKKTETSNIEAKAKMDSFVQGYVEAGVVMKDGRRAAVTSPVDMDIKIEADEMMTARSKGIDAVEKLESNDDASKVKKDVKASSVSGSDAKASVVVMKDGRRASPMNVVKDDSIMPNMVEQDSGLPPAKMNLRRIYDPFHAKNAHKFSDDQIYRMLASCSGSGACMNSPNSCIKNGSCSSDFSCSNSPNLLVEEDACSSPGSCSNSSSLAVGMGSCTGGAAMFQRYSCFESPNGCIGQRSCLGGAFGACKYSPGIFVGDDSCLYDYACSSSPDATIKQSSCHGDYACFGSANITVDKYSCRDDLACSDSRGPTIGRYACNCRDCCSFLNESCMIPDFQCNGGPGDCMFSFGNYSCPDFSDLN